MYNYSFNNLLILKKKCYYKNYLIYGSLIIINNPQKWFNNKVYLNLFRETSISKNIFSTKPEQKSLKGLIANRFID